MSDLFGSIRTRKPRSNKFDLSHERKMSMQMGKLVPILVQETVPGDKFRLNTEVFMRLAPMLAPIMHRVNVFVHYFFVPNRLLWDEWEDFITGGREGTSNPIWPHIASDLQSEWSALAAGTLGDYLGIPDLTDIAVGAEDLKVSALPFRAYQLIYDEYYRDQNLEVPLDISKASGSVDLISAEGVKLSTLRTRAWEKDYFTSALPWAQRGAAVGVPLEGVADVEYKAQAVAIDASGNPITGNNAQSLNTLSGGLVATGGVSTPNSIDNIESVTVENVDFTINALRRAVKLQEWLEKNARGGARYKEQILSHFGVVSSDARLQRPEYLGGGRTPVVVSEVLSNYTDPDVTDGPPQGNMTGHGIAVGNVFGFRRFFEEHGFIIGIMSVLPRTAYQNGLSRMFSRISRFDYYWPEFAHLGEQEILNQEVMYQGGDSADTETWGYQSRYAEYKYGCSSVHGDFKTTLDMWHMGRIFDPAGPVIPPPLNEEFVKSDPTQRIFAVTDEAVHKLYVQVYNRIDALRPMPYYGTPKL